MRSEICVQFFENIHRKPHAASSIGKPDCCGKISCVWFVCYGGVCQTNLTKHDCSLGGFLFPVKMEVQAPPGTPVGYVVQNWHACLPKFTIQDEKRMDILKISGPCVACSCCDDVNFEVCKAKSCLYVSSFR